MERGAYPRGRGATGSYPETAPGQPGLSPRARGNPVLEGRGENRVGPIPAGAGQPRMIPRARICLRAYPRGRGATRLARNPLMPARGLSPRARGNPNISCPADATMGPIPAGAGQPAVSAYTPMAKTAYPRGRGATYHRMTVARPAKGLSPRARGNPCQFHDHRTPLRPIPAGAGQPRCCSMA